MPPPTIQPRERSNDTRDADPPVDHSSEGAPVRIPQGSLPLDVVYDVLSNERRRLVMRYLATVSETTTLGELAERLASIENDKPETALSSIERKRVYIVLYQCHLPKLDDAGIIDFDRDRKTVTIGPNFEQVVAYLQPDATDDQRQLVDARIPIVPIGACAAIVLVIVGQLALPADLFIGVLVGVFLALLAWTVDKQVY